VSDGIRCTCDDPACEFGTLVAFANVVGIYQQVEDFMFMGTCDAGHPKVWLYKHCDTRGYLTLDAAGHAYYHFMARPDGQPFEIADLEAAGDGPLETSCRAIPYPDVATALAEVLP